MTVSMLFRDVYGVWVASEIVLQLATRTWKRSEVRDRGSFAVLIGVIFLSIWGGLWYAGMHRPTMGGAWLQTLGLVLLVAGLAVRWTAIAMLGRSFSVNVAIHATQTLYRGGLYRLMRHPSYTGMLLIFVGLGIEARNWGALAIILIPSTAALLYRIRIEEDALRSAFGEQYADYSRTTKRLVPGIY